MTKTVVLKVAFAKNDGVTKVQRPSTAPEAVPAPAPAGRATTRPPAEPGRVARLLALAYRVEQLIDDGVIADYREAARRLGISAAHLTHYVALLDLAVPIQEALLLGHVDVPERQLRSVAKVHAWNEQRTQARAPMSPAGRPSASRTELRVTTRAPHCPTRATFGRMAACQTLRSPFDSRMLAKNESTSDYAG